MSVDHTKVIFYSGFPAYLNREVKEATISVDGTSMSPSTAYSWETSVELEDASNFATMAVEINDSVGFSPATVTAMRWAQYPASQVVWGELDTDPNNTGVLELFYANKIEGNTVTFQLFTSHSFSSNASFVPFDVNVRYATFV